MVACAREHAVASVALLWYQRTDISCVWSHLYYCTTIGELGVHSTNLIGYMSAIPSTTPISDNANPATWMLEQIGAGTSARVNTQVKFLLHTMHI
jgi:hypothetical protein